jgi:hypothetical protein
MTPRKPRISPAALDKRLQLLRALVNGPIERARLIATLGWPITEFDYRAFSAQTAGLIQRDTHGTPPRRKTWITDAGRGYLKQHATQVMERRAL